jgi:signal transduction histidine kinase/CheY-like chemotaxis protein
MDFEAIKIQLQGIYEDPAITCIRLEDELGSVSLFGKIPANSQSSLSREYPLIKHLENKNKKIGTILFIATTDDIADKLLLSGSKMLGSQLAVLFLACLCILFLFVQLFNRHINRIVAYTESLKIGQLHEQLHLSRPSSPEKHPDELDHIVNALNDMRERLQTEISAQKKAKKNLIQEKLFSDAIINSLPGIFFVINETLQPVRYNKTFLEKLGLPETDGDTCNIFSRISPHQTTKMQETILEVLHLGEAQSVEIDLLDNDKQTTPYLFTITVLQLEQDTLLIGVGTNLRAQKRIEEQLRQAQKMEAIGTLSGGIAHDFNNILSAIVGYNQLALMTTTDNQKVQKYLNEVEKASNRAKDLVAQILSFSRKTDSDRHPIQMNTIVLEALKLLRSSIPTSIEIRHKIQSESFIIADSTEIHQIVMNLCTNAFHAMQDDGGILSVNLYDRQITDDDYFPNTRIVPGNYIQLNITDTGIGMDSATIEKIYEPYFTTKSSGAGTGLGLAVAHGIINQYNGYISVYSSKGSGTSFKIFLPITTRTKTQSTNREEKDIHKALEGSEHILIVDDNTSILDYYTELLLGYGYKATTFDNPKAALAQFETTPATFDLVLTDLTMPSMSGEQFGKALLSCRPDIPVILSSGFSATLGKKDFLEKGFTDFFQKPVDSRQFLLRIREIFDLTSETH